VSWHSIHVAYHGALDDLVVEAVRPFFATVADRVEAVYFVRHWRRGPHVRLNLRTAGTGLPAEVEAAAQQIIGGYLRARPSAETLVPSDYTALHERLARLEDDPGPLGPWYENNSMRTAPYEPGLGGIWTDFHVETTDLAIRMIDDLRGGRRRLTAGFDLLIATAHRLCGRTRTLTEGYPSFRSHAEGFLCGFPEGPAMRSRFDEQFIRHAGALVARMRTVVADLDEDRPGASFTDEWVRLLGDLQLRAGDLIAEGRPVLRDSAPQGYDPGRAPLSEASPFHRELETVPAWPKIRVAAGFQTYRFALNCLYLHLTKLGVTPIERFLLCHLAANTVEAGYGVTALEVLRGQA